MKMNICFIFICMFMLFVSKNVSAQHRIGSIAWIKGQETTELHGVGVVTGLGGRGDKADYKQTALAMGTLLAMNGQSGSTLKELGTSKNNALVRVKVTIPAEGARIGEELDCTVTAIGTATSIEGGVLDLTYLLGPIPSADTGFAPTFGYARGQITIEKDSVKTVGKITKGCRLTDNFYRPYIDQETGLLTLVLNQQFASMQMANKVAITINTKLQQGELAIARDTKNILVRVPQHDLANPVNFVADLLETPIYLDARPFPTVRINEAAGIVLIDESVEVDPISLTCAGITVQLAGGPPAPVAERFVALDIEQRYQQQQPNPKLKAICDAMNEMRVPPEKIIAIIKELDKMGKIHGTVIIGK